MRRSLGLFWVIMSMLLMVICSACGDSDEETVDGDSSDGDMDVEASSEGELSDGDTETEAEVATGLPASLAIEYSREDTGEPVTEQEVRDFTLNLIQFMKKVHYYDYILYTTHGIDASTGLPDWQFWYNERFKKEGDLVTFYHPENLNDGGHNLHIPLSRVLGDTLAAYMLIGDDTMGKAAEQLCKGYSASMLGMVHDEDDDLPHLMTRNVVPALNHEFLTHDGKRKAVDYSGWFSPYDRWNCYRYKIENNPYWGEMWVTNLRSKDDVPHVFRFVPVLRYAVESLEEGSVKEACGETLELLETFAKDIVESDYRIRTKDANGEIMIPGYTDDPDLNKLQGDLASFINYREFLPEGECNARRGAELIGYHHSINEDCGRGEPNGYDKISFAINRYNKRICRYFHLAHLANALVNRDNDAAQLLIDGLDERMNQEKETPESEMGYAPEDWWRNVALYLTQSHSFGYPLTSDDVRLIHTYYKKAINEYNGWPYWDPWDESVPDLESAAYRPPNCRTENEETDCWWRVEDLGQIFENCWSPLVNPTSASFVDCDLVRDPEQWKDK